MKRILAFTLLMALLLVGCGQSAAAPQPTEAPAAPAPTEAPTAPAPTEAPAPAEPVRIGAMTGPTGMGLCVKNILRMRRRSI